MAPPSVKAVLTQTAITGALTGLGFGLSLIVAIGPQNAYVLRAGLLRHRVLVVVAICALSDIALIAAGVAGAGAAIDSSRWVLPLARVAGAAFLLGYAALAARRALRASGALAADVQGRAPLLAIATTTLALTWLNPAVYLDTVVLLGSVASAHRGEQWWFAAGAGLGSVLWFCGIGFGARVLGPFLRRASSWRLLDGFVAVVMAITAVRLLIG